MPSVEASKRAAMVVEYQPHHLSILQAEGSKQSGEVSQEALPDPGSLLDYGDSVSPASLQSSSESESELGTIENMLRVIWSEILGENIEDIDEKDTFFDLGGDSLSATHLVVLAKERGMTLSVEDVFRCPTLPGMAAKVTVPSVIDLEEIKSLPQYSLMQTDFFDECAFNGLRSRLAERCVVKEDEIEDIYPCSPLQEAMMAVSQGGRDSYMTQLVYGLNDNVALDRFRWAWQNYITSNPVMRTRILRERLWGTLQCVIDNNFIWNKAVSLVDYLSTDSASSMREGDPLLRLAIIIETHPLQKRYLALTIHHAIVDATSLSQILNDVAHLYQGSSTPTTRPSFTKYIEHIQKLDLSASDRYWTHQLKDVNPSPFPPLPENDMEAMASSAFVQEVQFPWTNTFGLTKSLLLRAAWAILMGVRSNNTDVTFAVTQSGRSASITGITDITGPTITAVPVRVKLDFDMNIREFLGQILEQASNMMAFEHYGSLNVRRRLGEDGLRACTFQNLLLVQLSSDKDIEESLTQLGLTPFEQLGMPFMYDFPLVNECTLTTEGYHLNIRYDDRNLSKSSVLVLASQFNEILKQLCNADRASSLSSIRCFSSADFEQIRTWNPNIPEAARNTAHAMFQKMARSSPLAQAVCAWDGNLSFDELDSYTTIFGNFLTTLGVGPEVLVPICFEKSMWAIVAILAVLKAGGAWIPLDPKHPIDRLKEVMHMARATIIVTSTHQAHHMTNICKQVVVPEDYLSRRSPSSHLEVLKSSPVNYENTAYVLFTSGSTGKPKGVVISHTALCTAIVEQAKSLGCNSGWRSLQFSAHTFDPSISETLMTLCHGGCVCVPSDEQRLNNIPGAIRVLNVNCVQLTPSVAHVMFPEDVPSLQTMIFVGEAATSENVARWASKVRLLNAYGPTESCIYCSVKTDISAATSPLAIGTACGGNNYIIEADNHERLAAVGCVGEIVVAGHSLGKGYLGDEAATSAAFVTCSWLEIAQPQACSNRIYRTGDLAYYNSDGSMQLVGRKDNLVKLRGNRIELGEIEHRLLKFLPDATILASVPVSGPCKQHLVALLCFDDIRLSLKVDDTLRLASDYGSHKARLLLNSLRQRLSREVPEYMVPAYWVILERFPLNSSGKLDRKAVRERLSLMDNKTYKLIANSLANEEYHHHGSVYNEDISLVNEMRGIWSTLLQVDIEKIDPNTSFFFVGGDSLSAIKIVAHCRAKGLVITVQDIFQCRTLGKLCQTVRLTKSIEKSMMSFPAVKSSFALSALQKRFLALHEEAGRTLSDYQSSLLHMLVELPQNVLKQAFDSLVQRHPMLRTRFSKCQDGWEQRVVNTPEPYRLKFTQYGYLSEKATAEITNDGYNSIDIIHGPVFSVDVYRTVAGSFMLIVGHHLVLDKKSWQIVLHDIEVSIATRGKLPTPASTFREWNYKQNSAESTCGPSVGVSAANLDNWGLVGAESNSQQDPIITWTLDARNTGLLMENAKKVLRIDIFDALLAALMRSFSEVFKNRVAPTIYMEDDSRRLMDKQLDVHDVVGQFGICYPITIPVGPDADLEHTIKLIKELRSRTGNIRAQSGSIGELIDSPELPEIYFRYEPVDSETVEHGSVFANVYRTGHENSGRHRNGLVDIAVELRNGKLTFTLAYDARIEYQGMITQWVERYRVFLADIAQALPVHPQQLTAVDFPLLRMEERAFFELKEEFFRRLTGVDVSNIEDIYPCSPMQEDMLACQTQDPSLFSLEVVMEIGSASRVPINVQDLAEAWNIVIQRHSILRTFFFFSRPNSAPLQVVLRCANAQVEVVDSLEGAISIDLNTQGSIPPHRLILSQSSSGVKCLLQVNHALTDGWSLAIIKRDLLKAYLNKDLSGPYTPYRAFIANSVNISKQQHLDYWARRLGTCKPCILLSDYTSERFQKSPSPVTLLELPTIQKILFSKSCQDHGLTLATIIDTSWALTLHAITNSASLAFGYIILGRDPSIPGVNEMMGPALNMLINHATVRPETSFNLTEHLLELAMELQASRIEGLAYDGCSPMAIQRACHAAPLFNTAVNFQLDQWLENTESDISISSLGLQDPWNVDVMVRVWIEGGGMRSRLEYKPDRFSAREMERVAETFSAKLQLFAAGEDSRW